jgi:hypothetical protein
MAIVDDYAAIAAELRRLKAERQPEVPIAERPDVRPIRPQRHPTRRTAVGELLYRRLVLRERR